uniref:MADS-box domain-containing protein n=1 Tax=Ananas comosus var. bracteatus TaxID=296719 RepID=A0A6V7P5M2_ANACO|nr:unnamed protein product [Ananas comosus var. bracteatus]
MGYTKVPMEARDTLHHRKKTYRKRHPVLKRRVEELGVLCEADAVLLMFSPPVTLRSFAAGPGNPLMLTISSFVYVIADAVDDNDADATAIDSTPFDGDNDNDADVAAVDDDDAGTSDYGDAVDDDDVDAATADNDDNATPANSHGDRRNSSRRMGM